MVSRSSCAEIWGLEENSRGWRMWLIIAVFLGLIVNFIAVLGCLSPTTDTIHLYKLDAVDLLDAVEIVSNSSSKDLEPGLPKTWYWGLAGVCDDNSHCQSSFPPTYSLGSMVEYSLNKTLTSSQLKPVLSSWYTRIHGASIDGHSSTINPKLHEDRQHFVTFSRASAALAILALLTSATILGLALASLKFKGWLKLWQLYLATFVDGMLLLASTVLAIYAMNYGPRSILLYAKLEGLQPGGYIGPGMYVLVAGVVIKFLAIAGVFLGFIILGFVSLMMACLAAVCACGCLAGAVGSDGTKYKCKRCGWSSTYRPAGGVCPHC